MNVLRSRLRTLLKLWDDDPEHWTYAKVGWVLFSCCIIIMLSWRSLNFYSYHRLFTDSSVFISVSQHINAGMTLYKDVWDHKPPVIYALNSRALAFGEPSIDSIRMMERILAVLAHLAFFFALLLFLQNPFIACLSTLAFHFLFYEPRIFQGGNLTEEYGVYFILYSLFFLALLYHNPTRGKTVFAVMAGICFSLAVLSKEPFILSLIAWSLSPLISAKTKRQAFLRALSYMGGILIPLALTILTFLWWGNLLDWLNVIHYNLQYAQQSSDPQTNQFQEFYTYLLKPCWTLSLFFGCGVVSVFFRSFVKKMGYLPWIVFFAFIMDSLATMVSGYDIGHYFLQPVYSFVFLAAIGVSFLSDLLKRFHLSPIWILFILLVCLPALDWEAIQLYKRRMSVPYREARIGPIAQKIISEKTKDDRLWASFGEHANYYVESGMLSPAKYFYIFEHSFLDTFQSTREEKIQRLRNDLQDNPPRFVILSADSLLRMEQMGLNDIADWLTAHYQRDRGVQEQKTYLYEFRE